MIDLSSILHFLSGSTLFTYIVLIWLSFYFIVSFAILFSRLTYMAVWLSKERDALEDILTNKKEIFQTESILRNSTDLSKNKLELYKNVAEKKATIGLTWLSIIASTSPFIGLFGTVISILETFGGLGSQNSLSIIAPKISEALVATGFGIFVAIPAYTFHLIIKRRAFELLAVLDSEIKVLIKD